jgi:hypothetical protein
MIGWPSCVTWGRSGGVHMFRMNAANWVMLNKRRHSHSDVRLPSRTSLAYRWASFDFFFLLTYGTRFSYLPKLLTWKPMIHFPNIEVVWNISEKSSDRGDLVFELMRGMLYVLRETMGTKNSKLSNDRTSQKCQRRNDRRGIGLSVQTTAILVRDGRWVYKPLYLSLSLFFLHHWHFLNVLPTSSLRTKMAPVSRGLWLLEWVEQVSDVWPFSEFP